METLEEIIEPDPPICDALLQREVVLGHFMPKVTVKEQAKQCDVRIVDKAWRNASCLFNQPGLTHFIHNPLTAITVGLEISTFRWCFMDLKRDVAIPLHVHMTANSVLRISGRKRKAVKLGERVNI
jgi:hypothetical protein